MKFKELINAPLANLHAMRELQLILDLLKLQKDDKVLEIGPGSATGTFVVSKHVRCITGVDISRPLIDFLNKNPKPDNVDFCVMDATKEPPNEFVNKFDKCICVDVLEHVEDPKALLNFVHKILITGGCLGMTFPINNPHHGRNYFTRKDVYELFEEIDELESRIKTIKLNRFGSLIDRIYGKTQSILKPPKEADKFEDLVCFDMLEKPKKIYYLIKLGTVLLFKMSPNPYYEDEYGDRALIIAEKVK